MKTSIFSAIFILYFTSRCLANVSISPDMRICRDIEMDLNLTFIKNHKELPSSWDEFTEVKMTNTGSTERNIFRMKTINSFALVPNRPEIKLDQGIPKEYSGKFLYLIGKKEINSKNSGSGRCAILIAPSKTDTATVVTYSYLIPEDIAKIIIRQIENFDPEKQPVAFPGIQRLNGIEKNEADKLENRGSQNLNIPNSRDVIPSSSREPQYYRNTIIYSILGGFLPVLFLFLYFRAKRSS